MCKEVQLHISHVQRSTVAHFTCAKLCSFTFQMSRDVMLHILHVQRCTVAYLYCEATSDRIVLLFALQHFHGTLGGTLFGDTINTEALCCSIVFTSKNSHFL